VAAARPAPARVEPAASSSRGDAAPSAAAVAPVTRASEEEEELEADEADEVDEAEATADGPPPPVVPALRKGAKASLRRKGAR
jgi:hypothetical protein